MYSPIYIYIYLLVGNQYKELHEEHIRNDSILTHVGQSKKNIYTDTRIDILKTQLCVYLAALLFLYCIKKFGLARKTNTCATVRIHPNAS